VRPQWSWTGMLGLEASVWSLSNPSNQ
jgi:hypothetical protein